MLEVFDPPYVQRGLLEIALLAVGAGVVGPWIVLRGLAFFSHAVGTAAFPGLVLADGLGFAAGLGAFGTSVIFAGGVQGLARRRGSGHDALTAMVLVGCLATGVILASDVFASGSSVETLLFGSLLLIDDGDVTLAAVVAGAALFASALLGRHWLAAGFDADVPAPAPLPAAARARRSELVLLFLIALSSTAALSAVGALLTTALFVVPAATTRLLDLRMGAWQAATVALVVTQGVLGIWLSVQTDAPPGATIAVISSGTFVLVALGRLVNTHRPRRAAIAAALAGAAVIGGCGSTSSGTGGGQGRLDVVATTTQLGDIARAVAGDAADVQQILKPNSDPHDYEPRPSDVEATADAKVVLQSGDNLDPWMGKVVSQSGGKPAVTVVGDSVPVRLPGEGSGPEASRFDPHWWHDPSNVEAATRTIRDALGKADTGRQAEYARNADAYLAKLATLQAGIERCFAAVPAAQRKLVTDHDAFNYFAKRFGIDVVGTIIPAQTTQAQPSAGALAKLAAVIGRENVKAVFPESSLNPKLARAIARQTGATADHALYGDTLGPAGSKGTTYLSMEAANADSMVKGFTGGKRGCVVAGI